MSELPTAHGMWRELRSWPVPVQIGAAGFAAAAIGLALAMPAIYSGPDYPDESEWPEGNMADPGERVVVESDVSGGEAETETESGPGTRAGSYSGDPLWTEEVDAWGDEALHVDEGLLVHTDEAIRLESDGETVWKHTLQDAYSEVGLAGDLVVVSEDIEDDDSWPGLSATVALDLATGEEVWSDREASFVTVFADTVFMTECTGEQDDHIGDCTLYARDPADLSLRWSVPTYASAQILTASPWTGADAPDRVLVVAFPTGHSDRTVSVYESGAELLSVPTQSRVALDGDFLIVADDNDDNPADGCFADVAAYRLGDAEPVWKVQAMTRKTDDLLYCGELPSMEPVGGHLALTVDDEILVIDVATGETVWTAPDPGQAVALGSGGEVLVAAAWEATEDNLVGYEVGSGAERWRATVECCFDDDTWASGATMWIRSGLAVNLDDGQALKLPDSVLYYLPDQIVTSSEDEPVRLRAWPDDLWA